MSTTGIHSPLSTFLRDTLSGAQESPLVSTAAILIPVGKRTTFAKARKDLNDLFDRAEKVLGGDTKTTTLPVLAKVIPHLSNGINQKAHLEASVGASLIGAGVGIGLAFAMPYLKSKFNQLFNDADNKTRSTPNTSTQPRNWFQKFGDEIQEMLDGDRDDVDKTSKEIDNAGKLPEDTKKTPAVVSTPTQQVKTKIDGFGGSLFDTIHSWLFGGLGVNGGPGDASPGNSNTGGGNWSGGGAPNSIRNRGTNMGTSGGYTPLGGAQSRLDTGTKERSMKAMEYLVDKKGWTPTAAAIAVGNAIQESGVKSTGRPGDPNTPGGSHYMFQWNNGPNNDTVNGRRAQYERFAASRGKDPTDFETSLDFMDEERKRMKGLANWDKQTDLSNAGRIGHLYEGYGDNSEGSRVANARTVLAEFNRRNTQKPDTPPTNQTTTPEATSTPVAKPAASSSSRGPGNHMILALGTNDWTDEKAAYAGVKQSIQALRAKGWNPTLLLPRDLVNGRPEAHDGALRAATELGAETIHLPDSSFGTGENNYHITPEAAKQIRDTHSGWYKAGDSNSVRIGANEGSSGFSGIHGLSMGGKPGFADKIPGLPDAPAVVKPIDEPTPQPAKTYVAPPSDPPPVPKPDPSASRAVEDSYPDHGFHRHDLFHHEATASSGMLIVTPREAAQ